MAGNLLKAGLALTVYNSSPGPEVALRGAGAKIAESPAALALGMNIIISMTSDDSALAEVTSGAQGAFGAAARGTLFIDMSTVSPDISAGVAARAAEAGIHYLRAPVSGGVPWLTPSLSSHPVHRQILTRRCRCLTRWLKIPSMSARQRKRAISSSRSI